MDEMDKKILRLLQGEAGLSIAAISERIGLSHTPCWRRMKRLQSEGYIRGTVVLLDPAKLGLQVNVIANVKLKAHGEEALEAFEQSVQEYPEIIECFSMSGESDYMLRILIASIEDYEHFLKRVLVHLPGVAAVNSGFALKSVKISTEIPII